MTKFKIIRNIILAAGIFFLLITVANFTGMERPNLSPGENGIRTIVAPLQSGATAVVQKFKDFIGVFTEVKTLREENIALKKQISELKHEIDLYKDFALENIRLRDLLEYKSVHSGDFNLLSAKIVARDPGNWHKTVIINRGLADGVRKDMAVVTHEGLVGRIINVTSRASEVLLIIDQEGAVGGQVWETRETPGVVEGKGDGTDTLTMIHLPHDALIREGHTIVTSGLGGIFPPGIRIGKVTEVYEESSGLMKRATVEPFVDFSRLEEVLIILDVNEAYLLQQELSQQSEEALEQ